MHIADRFELDAGMAEAWVGLADVDAVVDCIPGLEIEDQLDDTTYLGALTVQFGPTRTVWRGQATFTWDEPSHVIHISARGADGKKATRASAAVTVGLQDGPRRVEALVTGDLEVVGPLAAFANSGGAYVLRALLEDFEKNFNGRLTGAPSTSEAVAGTASPMKRTKHDDALGATRLLRRALRLALLKFAARLRPRRAVVTDRAVKGRQT